MVAIIAASATLSVVFLVLLTSFITYRMTFYNNPNKHPTDLYGGLDKPGYVEHKERSKALIDNMLTLPYEKVQIKSRDGLILSGRYYHNNDTSPLVIEFHGYKSSPMIDFSGIGVHHMSEGYNVLMIDERASGDSEGRTIGFGRTESQDCLAWIEYAINRFGSNVKILIEGVSMGGATVLIASALELPENVLGIHADCPYSSAEQIIKKVIAEMKLPPKILFPFVRLGGIIFGGFDVRRACPAELVKSAKIPILLTHGEADAFVPCQMSREIYDGAPKGLCEFHTFPEAAHGMSFILDTPRYLDILHNFLVKIVFAKECRSTEEQNTNSERITQ